MAANLPTYNACRQLCNSARVDPYENYDIPTELNFELDGILTKSLRGEFFLLHDNFEDSDNTNRMLIFSTEKNLQLLNEYPHWLCVGTFDVAPSIFTQLFSVHIIKNGKSLPLVYSLFENKLESTYNQFFGYIKNKVTNSPKTISTDFKLAIINSIEEIFPETKVCRCFFHFKKSIWRHIQQEGLSIEYCDMTISQNLVRLYSKKLVCLAFIPLDDVLDFFILLQKNAPAKINKLYKYFEETYIGLKGRGRYGTRKEARYHKLYLFLKNYLT